MRRSCNVFSQNMTLNDTDYFIRGNSEDLTHNAKARVNSLRFSKKKKRKKNVIIV